MNNISTIGDKIILIHENDKLRFSSPRAINTNTSKKLYNILKHESYINRMHLARYVINTYKIKEFIKYLFLYEIEEVDRIELALQCAKKNGYRVSRHIKDFNILLEEDRLKIAIESANQNPRGFAECFNNFDIKVNKKLVNDIFSNCLMKDPESIESISNFFPKISAFILPVTHDSFISWMNANLNSNMFPPSAIHTLKKIKRVNVAIRFLIPFIKNEDEITNNIPTDITLFNSITGFEINEMIIFSKYDINILYDFYQLSLDVQAILNYKLYNIIKINIEILQNKKAFIKLINILESLLECLKISFLDEIFKEIRVNNFIELDMRNINEMEDNLLKARSILLNMKLQNIPGYENKMLSYKIADIEGIKSYILKNIDNDHANKSISNIFKVAKLIESGTFSHYRYNGSDIEKDDKAILESQIGFLNNSQLEIWKQNRFKATTLDLSEGSFRGNAQDIIELYSILEENKIFFEKKPFNKLSVYDLISLKDIINNLLKSNICDGKIANILTLFSKNIYINEKKYIIITCLVDNPNLMLNIGSLVKAFSCHNLKYGSYTHVIPSYILDPNIKILLGYIVNEKNIINRSKFDQLYNLVKSGDVYFNNINLHNIEFEYQNGKDNIPIKHAHFKQIIKIGQSEESKDIGIIGEEPLIQTHQGLYAIYKEAKLFLNGLIKDMGISDDITITIPKSRSILPSYSNIAGGIQTKKYLLSPKKFYE